MEVEVSPETLDRIKSYADQIFDFLSELEDDGGDIEEISAGLLIVADRICEDYDGVAH